VVKEHFIPVALNLQIAAHRQDAEGVFFRSLAPGESKFTGASGRIHGMTASGKFLCANSSCRDCSPAHAWKRWNDLPKAERKPGAIVVGELGKVDPKVPAMPAGGLFIQVYQSRLLGEVKGKLQRRTKAETFSWGVYEPGRDSLWLTEAEWKSLVPAEARKGKRFPLPARVADQITWTLTDVSEANGARWEPRHIRAREMTLTVEEASATAIRLRLEGSVRLAYDPPKTPVRYHVRLRPLHHEDPKAFSRYDANLLGHLTYDREKKAFTRFDVVALGEYVGALLNPYRVEDKQDFYLIKPCPLGVAFELGRAGVIVPPSSCRDGAR
jgi:hypothetical protein